VLITGQGVSVVRACVRACVCVHTGSSGCVGLCLLNAWYSGTYVCFGLLHWFNSFIFLKINVNDGWPFRNY